MKGTHISPVGKLMHCTFHRADPINNPRGRTFTLLVGFAPDKDTDTIELYARNKLANTFGSEFLQNPGNFYIPIRSDIHYQGLGREHAGWKFIEFVSYGQPEVRDHTGRLSMEGLKDSPNVIISFDFVAEKDTVKRVTLNPYEILVIGDTGGEWR